MFVTSLLLSLRHPRTHSECVYMHSTRPSPVSCRSERWKKRENGKNSWKLTLKRSTMKTKVCRAPPGGKCAVEQRWGLEKRICVFRSVNTFDCWKICVCRVFCMTVHWIYSSVSNILPQYWVWNLCPFMAASKCNTINKNRQHVSVSCTQPQTCNATCNTTSKVWVRNK